MQARSELMKFAVNESNQLAALSGTVNAAKAKEYMRQALEHGLKTVAGKEKVRSVVACTSYVMHPASEQHALTRRRLFWSRFLFVERGRGQGLGCALLALLS